MGQTDLEGYFFQADNLRNNAKIDLAISAYRNIAGIAEREGQSEALARALHMAGVSAKISASATDSSYYRDALAYYESAQKVFTQLNDLIGLGAVYRDMGTLHDGVKNYTAAGPCFEKSLEYSARSEDPAQLGITLVKYGLHYMYLSDYPTAEKYMLSGLKELEKAPTAGFYYATALLNLSEVMTHLTQYVEAIDYAEQSLSWFEADHEGETYDRRLAQIHGLLALLKDRVGQGAEAAEHRKKYTELIKNFDPQALRVVQSQLQDLVIQKN